MTSRLLTNLNGTGVVPSGTAGTPHDVDVGTNLYRLGVFEETIQATLRHANVSTTNSRAADDTKAAMAKLESLVIGSENAGETAQ